MIPSTSHLLESGLHAHRAQNVGRNQELEAEDDCATQPLAELEHDVARGPRRARR